MSRDRDSFHRYEVTPEPKGQGLSQRILKHEGQFNTEVGEFSFPELREEGKGQYSSLSQTYGSLALTDPERLKVGDRDGQFRLNELLREPLGLEEEETRAIENMVQDRVQELSDQAKKEGDQRGYNEGLERGRQEAYSEFQQKGEEKLKSFENLVSELENAKSDILKENEEFLIELCFRISKKLFLKDVHHDSGYLVRLITEVIKKIDLKENISVRLSESDFQSAVDIENQLLTRMSDLKNLEIKADPFVKLGGCYVETQWSNIDARIEKQINRTFDSLLDRSESGNPKPATLELSERQEEGEKSSEVLQGQVESSSGDDKESS